MPARAARPVITAGLAAAVVIAAVITIVTVGRAAPPELPTLAEQPRPPVDAQLAYLRATAADGGCVVLADLASGSHDPLHCDDDRLRDLGWRDARTLQATGAGDGGLRRVVTVTVDGTVDERLLDHLEVPPRSDGAVDEFRVAERDDGIRAALGDGDEPTVTIVGPDGRERGRLLLDHGRGYRLVRLGWSPDGRWLAVRDSADRLLVVDDRARTARVAAEDVLDAAWRPRR